ncbi:MAG: acetyl-CoA carboxylase biotin carboxyl carrier protein [Candidatus Latescibacterota bacterium]
MREEKLRQVLKLFEESDIEELEVEHSFWRGTRLRLSRRRAVEAAAPVSVAPVPISGVAASSATPEPKEQAVDDGLHQVLSPMVGTFYRAASPESEDFVSEGGNVKPGQTLCIIEAMKIMNEIPADKTGQIVEALVENGQPVEYNQPLFKIRPA